MFMILTDHHQGVGLYIVKVTELFKFFLNNSVTLTRYRPTP